MRIVIWSAWAAMVMALVSCVSPPDASSPAASQPTSPPTLEMPAATKPVARQANPAVQALIAQAASHRARADFATASSLLERAVRIAPAEPEAYVALARLRLEQNRPREAEQMALKAANLPNLSADERESLWYLVAECRERQGNRTGADQARARAMAD